MSQFDDEDILSDFVTESREHLAAIEPDLLAMERHGAETPPEVINRVFRAIHSIKGGAGFFAFENLKRLSHAMESVLMAVREGALEADPALIDVVLGALDRLRAMLDDIAASESVPCQRELDALASVLEADEGVAERPAVGVTVAPAFVPEPEVVRAALSRGLTLYRITIWLRRDLEAQTLTPQGFLDLARSVGTVFDVYISRDALPELAHCVEGDVSMVVLFGTVLEPDLAALAVRLPLAQLQALDMGVLRTHFADTSDAPLEEPPASDDGPAETVENVGTSPEAPARDAPAARPGKTAREAGPETLRVKVELLTSLMNLAGELVLSRNQLLRALDGRTRDVPGLAGILQNVSQVTSEIQEGIMQTRMQPIGTVFNRFPRVVRDISRQFGKQIEVHIRGAEVELDKSIVELLADPLTHIIRNCADHAIETSLARRAAGKTPGGTIRLHAFHEGGLVNIEVTDDGRGIDPQKIGAKAVERGLVTAEQLAEMTEREIIHLVFAPGFSTAEQVSEVSGRGVGMDVVRTNTEKLGGHVEIETSLGKGTTVRLRLPLTLAIIPSMIVGVEGQRFAIPQVNVVEFVWVRAAEVRNRIEQVHGALVLRLRDKLLPLVRLSDALQLERTYVDPQTGETEAERRLRLADRRGPSTPEDARPDRRQSWLSDYNIVVLRVGNNAFGAVVDELFDIEEIVVKPLSSFLQGLRCFSGATILGDGRVVMILDAGGLASVAQLRFVDLQAEQRRRAEEEAARARLQASRRRSVIIFKAAAEECFAVPQEKVQRLERLRTADIQRVGDREFMQYRNEGLPLVRLDHHMAVRPIPSELEELYVIIPKAAGGAPAGILISTILDAVDVDIELKPAEIRGTGLLGSGIVNGRLTLFLDPGPLVARVAGGPGPGGEPTGRQAGGCET